VPAEPDAQRYANVFALYERAVQTPAAHVALFGRIFEELRGRRAASLREDFCGTFLLAKTWVASGSTRTAIAVDLDRTALQDGRRRHQRRLAPGARRRLRILRRDVRSVTTPRVDVVAAGNFSFWAITEWRDLVSYLRCVRRSLGTGGIVVLETAGGPGMMKTTAERTAVKRDGDFWFRYVWRQRGFNPITHRLRCSISFELRSGRVLRDAFVYDWRLWTLPEVERALREAGFAAVKHYWEGRASTRNGNGTAAAAYRATERAPNHHAWVCFVVGLR
jgi:hypothetical protein